MVKIYAKCYYRHLALSYSTMHPKMSNPSTTPCDDSSTNFGKQGGITNGAAWYSVEGGEILISTESRYSVNQFNFSFHQSGMQDFNYLSSNDFEITLELGCDKYPKAETLEQGWLDNKNALINYIWQVCLNSKKTK